MTNAIGCRLDDSVFPHASWRTCSQKSMDLLQPCRAYHRDGPLYGIASHRHRRSQKKNIDDFSASSSTLGRYLKFTALTSDGLYHYTEWLRSKRCYRSFFTNKKKRPVIFTGGCMWLMSVEVCFIGCFGGCGGQRLADPACLCKLASLSIVFELQVAKVNLTKIARLRKELTR